VINADSMQIYQELPIITAQPSLAEQGAVPHRLYGFYSCYDHFSVGQWLDLVLAKIEEVRQRGGTPILVGGTGMYIKSLVSGFVNLPPMPDHIREEVAKMPLEALHARLAALDPASHELLKERDLVRRRRALEVVLAFNKPIGNLRAENQRLYFPRKEFYIINVEKPRAVLYERINARFLQMLENGALAEVQKAESGAKGRQIARALGVEELLAFCRGEISLNEAIAKAQQYSRNYAKRQCTWGRHQFEFDEFVS
jgi:tRNA dimethylallyltransferase